MTTCAVTPPVVGAPAANVVAALTVDATNVPAIAVLVSFCESPVAKSAAGSVKPRRVRRACRSVGPPSGRGSRKWLEIRPRHPAYGERLAGTRARPWGRGGAPAPRRRLRRLLRRSARPRPGREAD